MSITGEQIDYYASSQRALNTFKRYLKNVLEKYFQGDITVNNISIDGVNFVSEGTCWGSPYTDYYNVTWDFFAEPEAYLEKQNPVDMVHCMAGVSRSPAIAYFIYRLRGFSKEDSLVKVTNERTKPNTRIIRLAEEYLCK